MRRRVTFISALHCEEIRAMASTRARKALPAKRSREAEALKKGVAFAYEGHTYTIDEYRKWSIDVLEDIDDQRFVSAVRNLLGEDQWSTFRSRHSTVGEFEDFLNLVMKESGQGNS